MQCWGECRGTCRARVNSRFGVVLCLEDIDEPLHQHSLSAAINKVKFNWLLGSTSSIQLAPAQIHTCSIVCETRPSLVPAFILAHDIQLNDLLYLDFV